jgi:hypothetical protein
MMEMVLAYKTALVWLSILSLLFFIFSLAALPWVVARIPVDYFMGLARGTGRVGASKKSRPASPVKMAGMLVKNMVGMVLIAGGIIMLFIPGQGLLTILAGMMLMDFPGKRTLILGLAGFESIQRGINWIRKKRGVPPLQFPR